MNLNGTQRIASVLSAESTLRSVVESHFRSRGAEVVAIESEEQAEELASTKFSLIILDWQVDFAFDFIRQVKINKLTSRTPVIGIYPDGIEPEMFPSITLVPDCEANESDAVQSLPQLADQLFHEHSTRPKHFLQDIYVRLSTQEDEIDKAHELFEALIEPIGFEIKQQVFLDNTFREALGNATEHGNSKDPSKMLRVFFMVDHEKMLFVVQDEGSGFDHVAYMAKASTESAYETTTSRRDTEARPGGLGVHIMKEACDSITFNDSGNAIFLMKYLPGMEPAAQEA